MSVEILHTALERAASGDPVALVTLVRADASTPREAGARMAVFAGGTIDGTIGGGRLEAMAIQQALEVLKTGQPRLVELGLSELEMKCGGSVSVFIEALVTPPRLLLFGGGHVGREVSLVCDRLGLDVHVVDDRAEWASAERFPEATVHVLDFEAAVETLGLRPTDHVVIVTRGHAHDQRVLEEVVGHDLAYLGMIGSRRKVHGALRALVEAGAPPEHIDAIRAPIGLDLGGSSPAEIAISVASEIVALRHGRDVIQPMKAHRK